MSEIRFPKGHYARGGQMGTMHCIGIVLTESRSDNTTSNPGIQLTPINSKGNPASNCYITIPAKKAQEFCDLLLDAAATAGVDLKQASLAEATKKAASAEDLIAIYGNWGEHPEWSLDEWINEVRNENTRRSYWDWVAFTLEGK
jgi:hypothetical protein